MSVHKCTSKSLATCTMVCVQVAFFASSRTCAPPVARHRGGFNIGSFLFVLGGATLPITSAHYDAISVRLRGGRPDRKVKCHNWSLLARGGVYFVLTAENRTAPFGGNSLFQSRDPRLMRVSSNGRTPASQAGYAGSTPVVRSRCFERRWEFRVLLLKARGCVLPLVGRGEPTKGTHANVV